jgi:hypothetical protein
MKIYRSSDGQKRYHICDGHTTIYVQEGYIRRTNAIHTLCIDWHREHMLSRVDDIPKELLKLLTPAEYFKLRKIDGNL